MGCYWSHLPQDDFLTGMDSLNSLAHELSEEYGVDFKYCRDTEAMRLWINPEDTVAPVMTVDEIHEPEGIRFAIATDGPVFQREEPFITVKTVYETYERLSCRITGENRWETVDPVPAEQIAKVSAAVCDSVGNQAKVHLDYVPDDIYIDDQSPAFTENAGTWEDYTEGQLWDLNARVLRGEGSVTVTPEIGEMRSYSVFFHGPGSYTDSARLVVQNAAINDTVYFNERLLGRDRWQHAGFFELETGTGNTLTLENLAPDKDLGLDVIRITPLVADKHFIPEPEMLVFGEVSVTDSAVAYIRLFNRGKETMTVSSLTFYGEKISIEEEFPITLEPMEEREIPVYFYTEEFCEYNDVIVLESDDPKRETTLIPVFASALTYFKLADNEDSLYYQESGGWQTSVTQAWGNSSRYASITGRGNYADFTRTLEFSGTYDIQYIVPNTVNAHNHADYIVMIDGTPVDTTVVDQNEDSGQFVSIGEYDLPADLPVTLRIQDNGGNTNSNSVLRADAAKFVLVEEKFVSRINAAGTPERFEVYPNYPNPFNPSTQIYFSLPEAGEVTVDFFDLQGRKVDRQISRSFEAGYHRITWAPQQLASGVYLYRVQSSSGTQIEKCTFVK